MEVAEGAVGGLENVIYCAEADPLKWFCLFRDKIVVALTGLEDKEGGKD